MLAWLAAASVIGFVASLIAAESLVTTETKAKMLRPVAEKCITAARKGGVHQHRQVVALIRLIGVSLIDFPGKHRLEARLVAQRMVLHAINAVRQRFGRPPLVLAPEP
ncbi:MAG: hypothetical protein B7X11_06595 [Acidobacteria bacterium 37-65-4]|nr:MAG: hypothetical protein B7X11_06595 [Acidobacteria bacterium 37-65-4]